MVKTKATNIKHKKRVAIFFWEGWLGVAPSIINATRAFAGAGYQVDIITRYNSGGYAPVPNFPEGVRVLIHTRPILQRKPFLETNHFVNRVREVTPQALKKLLSRVLRNISYLVDLLCFLAFSLKCTRNYHYTAFIGVDMLGIIPASIIGVIKKAPVLYWSLEIVFMSDFKSPIMKLFKRLERVCSRRAILTIVQDPDRAKILISENGVSPSKIAIVPNGPFGPPPKIESNFFRRKFGIPPGYKVILHIGMISPATLSLELAEEASKWPDDWILILHERANRDYSDPYIRSIQRIGKGKVLLSLEPVTYDDLDTLVASGQIGLVFYRKELGPNFAQIAGASGKLGHYLRCGLPVVCLDLPGLADVIRKYRCGISVKHVEEVAQAIQRILEDYSFYSTNAVKCYEEVYEFGVHFQQVLKQIRQLERHREDV